MTAAELKKWCEDRASVVLGTSGVFTPTGEEERLLAAMVVALESLSNIRFPFDYPVAYKDEAGDATHLREGIHALIAELKEKP